MQSVILHSGCKINLTLKILGRRPDGRHDLETLFFPLDSPRDELEIFSEESGGFLLVSHNAEIDPTNNTLSKAYTLFSEASGFKPSLRVQLRKGVPSGAGLGGGSADAAVFLQWLNQEAKELALNDEQLLHLAANVGADVPFFLVNKSCWGRGIGDILTPCNAKQDLGLFGLTLLLICPTLQVSTAWAYSIFDQYQAKNHLTNVLKLAKQPSSLQENGFYFENSFESPVFQILSELEELKRQLLRLGASVALMSGSGASFFALYRDFGKAQDALNILQTSKVAVYCHAL